MGDCWKLICLEANLMIKEQTLLVSSIQGQRCEPLTYFEQRNHCQLLLDLSKGDEFPHVIFNLFIKLMYFSLQRLSSIKIATASNKQCRESFTVELLYVLLYWRSYTHWFYKILITISEAMSKIWLCWWKCTEFYRRKRWKMEDIQKKRWFFFNLYFL